MSIRVHLWLKMIEDPDQPDPRLIAELVKRYQAAATRLRDRVLNPPGSTDFAREFNQARAAQILAQVQREIERLKGEAAQWTGTALSESMARGIAVADGQARRAGITAPPPPPGAAPGGAAPEGGADGTFALVDRSAVEQLARDTVGDLFKAADSMQAQAGNALRRMAAEGVTHAQVNAILSGGVIEGRPVQAIRELREALRKVHGSKVTIRDKNGDDITFGVGYYAKMVAVTKTREAVSKGRHARLASRGMDLVVIVGRISTNFCTAYMDKVFSISGTHDRYPALARLPGGGPPFHPNCTKGTAPFIEALADAQDIAAGEPDPDLEPMLTTDDRTELQRRFQATQGATQARTRAATLRTDAGRRALLPDHDEPNYQAHLIRQMGVAEVELGNDPQIGRQIVRAMQQVVSGGGTMPRRIEVAARRRDTPGLAAETSTDGVIRINPNWAGWRDGGETMRQWYEDGFASSDDPLHPIYHEAAHVHALANGFDHGRQRFDDPADLHVASLVSRDATRDMDEFIAEVRAGRTAGKRFAPSVINLYERLGGR